MATLHTIVGDGADDEGDGRSYRGYRITWKEGKRGAQKMVLPKYPKHDDIAGHCAWLTCSYNLDHKHPIIDGHWYGPRGSRGLVVLERKGAPDLRFEPAGIMHTASRMVAELCGHKIPTDGPTLGYQAEHCNQIADVVGMLTKRTADQDQASTTTGAIGAYLALALPQTGYTTYSNAAGAKFKAAEALGDTTYDDQRRERRPHYLIDAQTGHRADENGEVVDQDQLPELVVPVNGLLKVAREHTGDTVRVETLNAWMAEIGWQRITVRGWRTSGRVGRSEPGAHARIYAYRGRIEDTREDAAE